MLLWLESDLKTCTNLRTFGSEQFSMSPNYASMWVFMALYTCVFALKCKVEAQPWAWRPGDMEHPGLPTENLS